MPSWGRQDGGSLLDEQIHELTLLITKGDTVVQGKPAWELATEIAKEKIAHGAPEPQRPTDGHGAVLAGGGGRRQDLHRQGRLRRLPQRRERRGATGPNLSQIAVTAAERKPGHGCAGLHCMSRWFSPRRTSSPGTGR